jgi:hypothetical protein
MSRAISLLLLNDFMAWTGTNQLFTFNISVEIYLAGLEWMYRHGATLLCLRFTQFSSIPPSKYRQRVSKQNTIAFFHILFNSDELKSL